MIDRRVRAAAGERRPWGRPAVSILENPATRSSAGGKTSADSTIPASGTWASERYSAKRTAERRSTAQLRMARKARPDGCGRRAPRSNQALMPARSNAFSTRPRYSRGERRKTAISSKRTPPRTSSRIRRAISTHSRPSPGAEKSRTSPCARALERLARGEERPAQRRRGPNRRTGRGCRPRRRASRDTRAWRDRRTGP